MTALHGTLPGHCSSYEYTMKLMYTSHPDFLRAPRYSDQVFGLHSPGGECLLSTQTPANSVRSSLRPSRLANIVS